MFYVYNIYFSSFTSLGIQCVKKRDIEKSLKVREAHNLDPFNSKYEKLISFYSLNIFQDAQYETVLHTFQLVSIIQAVLILMSCDCAFKFSFGARIIRFHPHFNLLFLSLFLIKVRHDCLHFNLLFQFISFALK